MFIGSHQKYEFLQNGEVVVRKKSQNNSVTKVDSHLEDQFLQNGEIVMRKKKLASKKDEDDESANGGEKRASQLNPNAVEFVMSSSASQLDQGPFFPKPTNTSFEFVGLFDKQGLLSPRKIEVHAFLKNCLLG